ncbi:hypothetical protein BST13_24730 [Mycobacterium aquaticum]|uniref:Uncharacterized protein n=1 Tax=Mycobacterium aquaticum TaxID=1927124 RepID=A0A1X0APG6_9MYCO|nr:hypothetical protein BST13_24730 [Mycobacterium aquaticum]
MKPWPRRPKNLAEFDPAEWPDVQAWHAARAKVARSLGRSPLPEVRGMTRIRRGRNGRAVR